MAQHLFDSISDIESRLKEARHVLLLSDYDGTLTPIVRHADLALLNKDQIEIIGNLAANKRITFGLVSGRALNDLKNKVPLPGILYAGNHGMEIHAGKKRFVHPEAKKTKEIMNEIKTELNKQIKAAPGAWIEDKTLTLSLHYREVSEKALPDLERIFYDTVAGWRDKIKITVGKKVWEVRPPVIWDKGRAIEWIMGKLLDARSIPSRFMLPLYLGDDYTDEDGFRVLTDKGITVHIGTREDTIAKYQLDSVEQTYKFLQLINNAVPI